MFVIPDFSTGQVVGRTDELNIIYRQLIGKKIKIILLEGEAGIGKTAIANRLTEMASVGALAERFDSTIFQSMYQESWETGLSQLIEKILGKGTSLKADRDMLESQLLNRCQEKKILVTLDNIEINQQQNLMGFAKKWTEMQHSSVLVITSLTPLVISGSLVQRVKLSGLNGPYPLELLGSVIRQRFNNEELLDNITKLRGIPLNLLYLRWQDPKTLSALKRTVEDLAEGTLNKIDSLENILSRITQSPTHFMALGIIRQLQFDESLLAYFWDKMGGGNSEAYILHRDKLISNRLLIPIPTHQQTTYRISAEVHKNLNQALTRRIGGEKRIAIIHYLASEYYRKQFESNDLPAIDTLNAFVYHCFAGGDLLRAYKYLFESEILSQLQQSGRIIQLQALLETFLEFESGTALKVQEVLETLLGSDVENRFTNLQHAKILVEIAHTCSDLGQFNKCLELVNRAEEILSINSGTIDEPTRISLLRRIWYYSGVSFSNTGCSDQCIKSYFKIVSTSEGLDQLGCLSLGYLSHDLRYRDIQNSLRYASMATEISRKIQDTRLLAKNLCNLGETYTFIPLLDEANLCFEEAYRCCYNMPAGSTEQRELGRILKNWGVVALAQKDWITAKERLAEGAKISLAMGDQRRVASGMLYLGILYHQTRDIKEAEENLISCIRTTYACGDYRYLIPAILTYAKWKDPNYSGKVEELNNCNGCEQISEIALDISREEKFDVYADFWRKHFWPVFYE